MKIRKTSNIASISGGSHAFPYPLPRQRPYLSSACTAALASRSVLTTESCPFQAAKCSGVEPQEQPKPQAALNGTKGKNSLRKLGHLKSQSFEYCGHSNSPELKEHCDFERCLEVIELAENTCCLWYSFETTSAMSADKMT